MEKVKSLINKRAINNIILNENLPTGADVLLVALNTPAPNGAWGIPVLLWGNPGMGKSSFIESLARPDFPVVTLIASLHDPTDFSGLPVFKDDRVHFARPEWMDAFTATGQGILFLDELTTAPPAVQAALLRVVLERRVGFHKLPDGVRIVAAANPADISAGWELSLPLRNRFIHVKWDLPTNVYIDGQKNGFLEIKPFNLNIKSFNIHLKKVINTVCSFLNENRELLYKKNDVEEQAYASPRSWDFAQRLLAASYTLLKTTDKTDAFENLQFRILSGTVGEGIAHNLLAYIKNAEILDPEAVLNKKKN